MRTAMAIDPFEPHPEIEPQKANSCVDTLTLQQICDSIKNMMIQVRAEETPRRGYDKHYITAVLTGLMIELEEKCQSN